jgi:hypothetical protein
MNNLMTGDNSGAEPREHHEDCASLCEYADLDDEMLIECPWGHSTHDCNCDDLDERWWDAQAEAYCERMD